MTSSLLLTLPAQSLLFAWEGNKEVVAGKLYPAYFPSLDDLVRHYISYHLSDVRPVALVTEDELTLLDLTSSVVAAKIEATSLERIRHSSGKAPSSFEDSESPYYLEGLTSRFDPHAGYALRPGGLGSSWLQFEISPAHFRNTIEPMPFAMGSYQMEMLFALINDTKYTIAASDLTG